MLPTAADSGVVCLSVCVSVCVLVIFLYLIMHPAQTDKPIQSSRCRLGETDCTWAQEP